MEKITIPVEDTNNISDGYHTFGELYEHRITLFIALCIFVNKSYRRMENNGDLYPEENLLVWRTKKHSDNSNWDGWFVLGIGKKAGKQITYHLPLSKWDEVEFAETLEKAPEFDGHTPEDVLERIKNI